MSSSILRSSGFSGFRALSGWVRVAAFLVALFVGPAASATSARAEGVEWAGLTFDEAMEQAAETGQLVLVDVWAGHCGQCTTMKEDFWPSEEARRLAEGTIAIQIESSDPTEVAFRERYPILGLPAVILIDADGSEIARATGYYSKESFMTEAAAMYAQVDPLPDLEAYIADNPEELMVMMPLLETYLFRKRPVDAERILNRILELDPRNSAKQAEKAMTAVAAYYDHFAQDELLAQSIWKRFVETFPTSSAIGQGFKATFDHAKKTGTMEEWKRWACGLAAKHPENGRMQYSVAMWANRAGLRGECLAEAARSAHRLKVGPAWMDSLANVLAGPK